MSLDDRLRDAFEVAAGTIAPGTIKAQVLISPSPRRRRLAMFAPLAAAAAVVLVVYGATAISHLHPAGHAAGHATASPAGTPAAVTRQPPFVLMRDLNQPHNPDYEVRAAITGQLTASIAPPRNGPQWLAATGSGTGRTFVLTAGVSSGIGLTDTCRWSSYLLRLTAAGKVSSLTSLSVPGVLDDGTADISAPVRSADGSTLAYVATECSNFVQPSHPFTIVVVSHAVIHRYTVIVPRGKEGPGFIDSLSLSADGSELSYVIGEYTFSYPTAPGGAWVLPTSAPSGPAALRAREIFTDDRRHGTRANSIVLSSDGRTGYLLARTGGPSTLGYVLSAYDVSSGKLIRVVHTWHDLPFQSGIEVVGGDHAIITGWVPNVATEVNLITGAAGTYLPHALGKVAVDGLAW